MDIPTPAWSSLWKPTIKSPLFNLPEKGQVARSLSLSVTQSGSPYVYADHGYRIYYGTTHWVKKAVVTPRRKKYLVPDL